MSASVEVIAGVGAGQRASFMIGDDLPAYVLYGVAGPVTIAISASGFVTQTIDITVESPAPADRVESGACPASATGVDCQRGWRLEPAALKAQVCAMVGCPNNLHEILTWGAPGP